MSSTEEQDKELKAIQFFGEVLTPLALKARDEGISFFPLRPDKEAESYYVEPLRRVMKPSDFELRAADSIAEFVNELAALWISEGHAELAAMSKPLAELAAEMCEQKIEEEDVSPFMYVMF